MLDRLARDWPAKDDLNVGLFTNSLDSSRSCRSWKILHYCKIMIPVIIKINFA